MKRIIAIMLMLMAATLSAQNYVWDTGKFAGATDLRGKGVVLVDSVRTAGRVTASMVNADSVLLRTTDANGALINSPSGNYAIFNSGLQAGGTIQIVGDGGLRFYSDQCGIYNDKTGVFGLGSEDTSGMKVNGGGRTLVMDNVLVDTLGIGGGAKMTSADTSAAGDSTKIGYVNGNKSLIFGTEVKAP